MHSNETISVMLPSDLVGALRASVAAGEYVATGEAVEDAVCAWQIRRQADAERLDAIRIRRALDESGLDRTGEEVRAHFKALHAETVQAHRDALL